MENKTGKYFKYAIGEIVLVVIGILIALWINSTYNDYKEKKVEKIVLNNILADIESDYKQLTKIDSIYSKHIKKLREVRTAFFKNQNDSIKSYIKQLHYGADIEDLNPRTTTYDEMINSGKLYNLSNKNLVDLFVNYYEMHENNTYERRQDRTEFRNLHYAPEMNDYWLLYHNIRQNNKNVPELIESFVKNKNSLAYKTLKTNSAYGCDVINRAISDIKKIKEANRNLKSKLESELEIKK